MIRILVLLMATFTFALNANTLSEQIRNSLVNFENFPRQGVIFRDISPIIENSKLFTEIIDNFYEHYKEKNIDAVVALEARGFILGAPLAYKLKVPLFMIRKEGKLPGEVYKATYKKMYGEDVFIMHKDALHKGQQVIIIDDFYSTGGSLDAAVKLVLLTQATVYEACFLINNKTATKIFDFQFPIYALTEINE